MYRKGRYVATHVYAPGALGAGAAATWRPVYLCP